MLKIVKVSKSYNKKIVLSNISFEFKQGEILGISGRSGIGKSTLGKLIVGLEQIDSGEIFYQGEKIITNNFSVFRDKKQAKKLRRDIQFIFQNPYTALDNKVKVKKFC